MARDGEVLQRQHFCHQGDTICHPKSGCVATKLHGTSTCGSNDNTIFSDRAIFAVTQFLGDITLLFETGSKPFFKFVSVPWTQFCESSNRVLATSRLTVGHVSQG